MLQKILYCRRYIHQGTDSLSQTLCRFGSIELEEVTKVIQFCFSKASRLVLTSLFFFHFGFGEVEDLMLDFVFLSNLAAFAAWLGLVEI